MKARPSKTAFATTLCVLVSLSHAGCKPESTLFDDDALSTPPGAAPAVGGAANGGGGRGGQAIGGQGAAGPASAGSASGPNLGGWPSSCAGAPPTSGDAGSTVYVDATNGSDAGDGSAQRPLRSITAGVERARPGDVVQVAAGNYSSSAPNTRAISFAGEQGTAAQPIVVRAAPGTMPRLEASGEFGGTLTFYGASHLVIDGFEITNPQGLAVQAIDSSDITIKNCKIHDALGAAFMADGEDITFDHNEVYDTAKSEATSCVTSRARSSGYSKRFKVTNNLIYDCGGECVDSWYVEDSLVADNVIHDCKSAGIYNDHARRVRIERNFVYAENPAFDNAARPGGRGPGVQLAAEPELTAESFPQTDIAIVNNVILGWGWGVSFWRSPSTAAANTYANVLIAHNVIADSHSSPLHFDDASPSAARPSNNLFANNLVYAGRQDPYVEAAGSFAFRNNSWLGGRAISGAGDVAAPAAGLPAITAGMQPENFRLAPGSLLRGAGTPLSQVATDFWCMPRSPQAPTIGIEELK